MLYLLLVGLTLPEKYFSLISSIDWVNNFISIIAINGIANAMALKNIADIGDYRYPVGPLLIQ